MQPSVIVQAALSILAVATAIQAAATVTLPDPTTTISASSSVPSLVTAAECRTNLECCEVVQSPPTRGLIGLPPQLPKLAGPLIGLTCAPIVPLPGAVWRLEVPIVFVVLNLMELIGSCSTFPSVCCDTVFTAGILAEGCVPVISE